MIATRLLLACSACFFFGCASTYQFTRGDGVPAARGTARVTHGANGNTRIALQVQHLANPSQVEHGAGTYVVWASSGMGDARTVTSLGALHVDENLSGSLHTVTALRNFDLFITPESEATVTAPQGKQVLSLHVSP